MFRIVPGIIGIVAGVFLTPAFGIAQSKALKPGDSTSSKLLLGNEKRFGLTNVLGDHKGYETELAITLKERQSLTVTVTVTGDSNRKLALTLLSPTGKELVSSGRQIKTAKISIKEASAEDDYRLVILSDDIGGFTVQTSGSSDQELNEEAIKRKIKHHEEEIEKLKQHLKEIQDKAKKE